jgi:hypothetical protein
MNQRNVGLPKALAKLFAFALSIASGLSIAQDQVPPPPYQIAGANHVFVGVIWDEAAIRKALPRGIIPVKEMTGAINIYQWIDPSVLQIYFHHMI